jgi:nucleotide-binding universal stress UspA family protein
MKRVLLAVDEDGERARRAAEGVTSLPGIPEDATVTLLNVFEEFTAADEAGQVRSKDLYDPEDFPDSALAARDLLEEAGLEVDLRREHGDPAEQIVTGAGKLDADVVALCGRKRSPAGKALFGSVTQSVILDADRPVLVAPGE